jgi:hypothetical protein
MRIWEATLDGSPLRNYTILWMVSKWGPDEVSDMIKRQKVPKEVFEQFAVAVLRFMEDEGERLYLDENEDLL